MLCLLNVLKDLETGYVESGLVTERVAQWVKALLSESKAPGSDLIRCSAGFWDPTLRLPVTFVLNQRTKTTRLTLS